jgi:hypothetical protein
MAQSDSFTPPMPSRPSNPALPPQGHHHEGCVADRRSHTRDITPILPGRDRRCPDAIDALSVNHRRSSIHVIAERWPAVGRVRQWESSLTFGESGIRMPRAVLPSNFTDRGMRQHHGSRRAEGHFLHGDENQRPTHTFDDRLRIFGCGK